MLITQGYGNGGHLIVQGFLNEANSSSSSSSSSSQSSESSSSSSSSSNSSSSSSSRSSESSSSSSSSSDSSESSSSSSSSDDLGLPLLDPNPQHNIWPVVLLNGSDPGRMSQIDQMLSKYTKIQVLHAPVTVHLVSPYAGSEIRYETNGRNPACDSKLYTGPLVFTRNISGSDRTIIKARIYDKTNANRRGRIIRLEFNVI